MATRIEEARSSGPLHLWRGVCRARTRLLRGPNLLLTPVKTEDAHLRRLAFLRQNYPHFGEQCLKVRDKAGKLVPLAFTPTQSIIHASAEAQKAETGKVRAITLKYRRAGASSYILGRGYHRASLNHGVSVAIMAHLGSSVNALYRIVRRFQDNNEFAPALGSANIKGLEFEGMDSRYAIYSSETEDAGRGDEISFLHLSEAGVIDNLEEQMAGIGNCVSDMPGTEIWLEGTAKQPFGPFFERCMDCLKGASEYKLIFVPWNKDPGCYSEPPADFQLQEERDHEAFLSERELHEINGLTLGQIFWRRRKMGGARNIIRWSREFPLTVSEAFNAVEEEAFISPVDVQRARKANILAHGATVMGVDPASMGGDRFTIAVRQGRKVKSVQSRTKVKFNEGLEWVRAAIEDHKPDRVFIDAGGGGNGDAISSALRDDQRYATIIRPVNFGATSQAKMARPDKPGPKNRKAEMAMRLKDALSSVEGLDIPDDDALAADFCSPQIQWINQEGDFQLVPKNKLKHRSHDLFDAVGLTYADPYVQPLNYVPVMDSNGRPVDNLPKIPGLPPAGSSWMS